MANPEEALFDSWQQGRKQGMSAGIRYEQEHTIKLLEKHVWQLDVAPNGKWKQRCRCGFYGVFNEHLIALIKGEQNG